MQTMDGITHDVIYAAPVDDVAAALHRHNGDVRATIRSLLDESGRLREQLALVTIFPNDNVIPSCSSADCI